MKGAETQPESQPDTLQSLQRNTIALLKSAESLLSEQLTYMKKTFMEAEEEENFEGKCIREVVQDLISMGATGTQKENEMKSILGIIGKSLTLRKTIRTGSEDTSRAMGELSLGAKDLRLVDYQRFKRIHINRILDIVCEEEKVKEEKVKSVESLKEYAVNIELAAISCYSQYITVYYQNLTRLVARINTLARQRIDRKKETGSALCPRPAPDFCSLNTSVEKPWHRNKHRLFQELKSVIRVKRETAKTKQQLKPDEQVIFSFNEKQPVKKLHKPQPQRQNKTEIQFRSSANELNLMQERAHKLMERDKEVLQRKESNKRTKVNKARLAHQASQERTMSNRLLINQEYVHWREALKQHLDNHTVHKIPVVKTQQSVSKVDFARSINELKMQNSLNELLEKQVRFQQHVSRKKGSKGREKAEQQGQKEPKSARAQPVCRRASVEKQAVVQKKPDDKDKPGRKKQREARYDYYEHRAELALQEMRHEAEVRKRKEEQKRLKEQLRQTRMRNQALANMLKE